MNKTGKLIYILLTFVFFTVSDIYFSNELLKRSFEMTENPLFDIVYVKNTGAAFSLFENSQLFLIIFGFAATILILIYLIKHLDKITTFTCFWTSMLLSGIICNLYERIAFGFVRDFFKLKFIEFPVFNISDIFINIGVIALIVIIIKNKYLKK